MLCERSWLRGFSAELSWVRSVQGPKCPYTDESGRSLCQDMCRQRCDVIKHWLCVRARVVRLCIALFIFCSYFYCLHLLRINVFIIITAPRPDVSAERTGRKRRERDQTFQRCTVSQCRTAVLHCCKGDAASQWEMAILGVSELRNPWTDRLKVWHTWLHRWVDLVCQIS